MAEKIKFYSEDCDYIVKHKLKIRQTINYITKNEQFSLGDINVIVCSDEYLLKMNNQYLQHNYYTDVITFDYGDQSFCSGDIFISYQTVEDNALSLNKDLKDEMRRVIFHGVLHLCGYKDKSDNEAVIMREKEDFYLEYYNKL